MANKISTSTANFFHFQSIIDFMRSLVDVCKATFQLMKPELITDDSSLYYVHEQSVNMDSYPEFKAVRLIMENHGAQCVSPAMIDDLLFEQNRILDFAASNEIHYVILESGRDKYWSCGIDLNFLVGCIENKDVIKLRNYADKCIQYLMNNIHSSYTSIAIIDGACCGNSFEMALSHDYIIAEEQAEFSFPELMYGLFPGMGAYSLLARKVGVDKAREMLSHQHLWTAKELLELGLVHQVVKCGERKQAVKQFMNQQQSHYDAAQMVDRLHNYLPEQVSHNELMSVSEEWIKLAINLDEKHLSILKRLADVQASQIYVSKK